MKCQNHPNAAAIENCARCEQPLCGMCANFTAEDVLCEPCVEIRENEKAVAAQTQKLDQPDPATVAQTYDEALLEAAKKQPKSSGPLLNILIIAACGVILAVRLLFFSTPDSNTAALSSANGLQLQTMTSLAQCMVLFRQIGANLVNGGMPSPNINCSGTDETLIIRETADNVIVQYPTPETFGYSEISVSRNNPNPQIIE